MNHNKILLQVGNPMNVESLRALLGNELKQEETTLLVSNEGMFRHFQDFNFKLMRDFFRAPKKSFSIAFMLPIEMQDFRGLRNIASAAEFGFLTPDYNQFDELVNVIGTLKEMAKSQKDYEKAKKKHNKKHESLAQEREEIKAENAQIMVSNLELKKEYQSIKKIWRDRVKALKDARKEEIKLAKELAKETGEEVEVFEDLVLPEEPVEPEYQSKHVLPELPKFQFKKDVEMNGDRYLGDNRFFYLLAEYKMYKITDTNILYFERRKEEFKYRVKDILKLVKILKEEADLEMSALEFKEYYRNLRPNSKLVNHRYSLNMETTLIGLLSEDIIPFSMDSVEIIDTDYPDLAPIPAQNQAAIMAGGDSTKSFRLFVDGDDILFKSSSVMITDERETRINGVITIESITKYENMFAEYNLNTQLLTLL